MVPEKYMRKFIALAYLVLAVIGIIFSYMGYSNYQNYLHFPDNPEVIDLSQDFVWKNQEWVELRNYLPMCDKMFKSYKRHGSNYILPVTDQKKQILFLVTDDKKISCTDGQSPAIQGTLWKSKGVRLVLFTYRNRFS
jgi:hypothetical protein